VGNGGNDRHSRRRVLEHAGDTGTRHGEAVNRGIAGCGIAARSVTARSVTARSVTACGVRTGRVTARALRAHGKQRSGRTDDANGLQGAGRGTHTRR